MKTIRFNTDRHYSEHGQRITATLHNDGVVTFRDHDRDIWGEFPVGQWETLSPQLVMARYDSNSFEGSARARQEAFAGCNTKP